MGSLLTKPRRKQLLLTAGFLLAFVAIYVIASARSPWAPAFEQTAQFERHYYFTDIFPYLTTYLLFTPEFYDSSRKYPLLLALHGASKRSFGAYEATREDVQRLCDCFVLMPMAPPYNGWANEAGPDRALEMAMDILTDVQAEYAIDPNRIYVTGHSMGAVGTFAALAYYPETFAAGVPINGYWWPQDAEKFRGRNLWVFHGQDDRIFPLKATFALVREIGIKGGTPKFTVMNGVGHDSRPAYRDPALWEWMLAQKRGP